MMRAEVKLEFSNMKKLLLIQHAPPKHKSRLKLKRTDNKQIGSVGLMPACMGSNCIARTIY